MFINKLYDYQPLERDTKETGERVYVTPSGNLPSVTTVLSGTANKSELEAWRKAVGDKKADQIRDEATALGSLMHEHLENHLQGIARPKGNNLVRIMAHNMADSIINRGLVDVDEIWGIEAPLYYPELYAGTADLIGVFKGAPALMDFKTTKKMKTVDMIEDYGLQLAAYSEAHNILHGTQIEVGVIFMVSRDLKYNTFVFEPKDMEVYRDKWWTRLDQFYHGPKS